MKKTTKEIWKYFLEKSFDYKKTFFLSIFSYSLGAIGGTIIIPYLYKKIVDLLTLSNILDKNIIFNEALILLLYIFVIYFLFNFFYRIGDFATNYFQAYVMRDIENNAYEKLQNHSYNFFSNSFSGALVTRVGRLRRAFERIHDRLVGDLIPLMIVIFFSCIVLYFESKILSYILFLWVLVYGFLMFFLYKWKYKFDLLSAKEDSKVTATLADSLSNILSIKTFSKIYEEKERYYKVSTKRANIVKKAWNVGSFINILQGILMLIVEIVIIFYSLKLWSEGLISVGTFILAQVYVGAIMSRMWGFGRIIRDVYESLADAEEMIIIMNQKPDVVDSKFPETVRIKNGNIKFENVTFSYEERDVFKNFNLEIKKGERVGIVGESGSGKTTLTKLILRFLDIKEGSIKIDGQDISKITQEDLRNQISYVSQEPLLFHRTLKENITYAKPYASEKELLSASSKANIKDFISRLPKGYDTMVGERGVKLSGGEKQRVAIARAMLKDSPILILDEATSSLDSKSEKLIQKAVDNLVKNRTTLVIAHRLSTIQKMDRIIVLKRGRIVEEGTHKQLLRKKGAYAQLWSHQAGGFLSD